MSGWIAATLGARYWHECSGNHKRQRRGACPVSSREVESTTLHDRDPPGAYGRPFGEPQAQVIDQ